jgi:hypothetical protein
MRSAENVSRCWELPLDDGLVLTERCASLCSAPCPAAEAHGVVPVMQTDSEET